MVINPIRLSYFYTNALKPQFLDCDLKYFIKNTTFIILYNPYPLKLINPEEQELAMRQGVWRVQALNNRCYNLKKDESGQDYSIMPSSINYSKLPRRS